jgi:hypothetical protein
MHVSTTTRRVGDREYNATLLRRSYREDGKVKKETLANLSHLPAEAIDALRRVLAGETVMSVEDAFEIERSLPAGHVTAALAMARRLELGKLLDRSPCRERDLCLAMIVGRVIAPGSKLGTSALSASQPSPVSWVWRAPTRMIYTGRWTGCWSARTRSRAASPAGICATGRWCSTTCPPATSRGGPVRWRGWGTRGTENPGWGRSSTGWCVTTMGGRSRSRCSPASYTTTRPCPHRSRS